MKMSWKNKNWKTNINKIHWINTHRMEREHKIWKISQNQQMQQNSMWRERGRRKKMSKQLLLTCSSFSDISSLRIFQFDSRTYEDPTVHVGNCHNCIVTVLSVCHWHILHLPWSWPLPVCTVDLERMADAICTRAQWAFYMEPMWWRNALYFLLCNMNLIGQFFNAAMVSRQWAPLCKSTNGKWHSITRQHGLHQLISTVGIL